MKTSPKNKMDKNSKIYIAGHKGLVGSAITRLLQKEGYKNLILKTRQELDLFNQQAVTNFFKKKSPNMCFWLLPKSVELWQTTITRQILFMKI